MGEPEPDEAGLKIRKFLGFLFKLASSCLAIAVARAVTGALFKGRRR
jgi:hypothetical protein